jgi:hypothetical protein
MRIFAKKHNLKLSWITHDDHDKIEAQYPFIQLGGCDHEGFSLSDPRQMMLATPPKERSRYLKRIDNCNLLRLQINQDFIEEVLVPLGFYEEDGDSRWDRLLEHLGFEHTREGDLEEVYLFPADSQLVVDMIFLLAQLGSAGMEPDSESFIDMSGGRAIYNPVELDG